MYFEFDDFDVRDRFFIIEEKTDKLNIELELLSHEEREGFRNKCYQAYVFHDSALDGNVVTGEEIKTAFSSNFSGSYLRSRVMQEVRNHRSLLLQYCSAPEKERDSSQMYRSEVVTHEDIVGAHGLLFRKISRNDPGDLRLVMPLHSTYLHDLVEPAKIDAKLRELCLSTEHPEFRGQHPINQAVLFHVEFMKVFPFARGNGKIGRIYMNSFLVQGGYDLSIIHGSERQRYYEDLKEGPAALRELLLESMEMAIESKMKHLKEARDKKEQETAEGLSNLDLEWA